jgi:predicted ABC-type ATPase
VPRAIILNGPLGIGKSTLGEALGEAIERSVHLDGDALIALNPPPDDEWAGLHATLAMLVGHHAAHGYDQFVINHYWPARAQLDALSAALDAAAPGIAIRVFRLTATRQENLRRIATRREARAIDETDFELQTFAEESRIFDAAGDALGEAFDVTDPPELLVRRMLAMLDA